MHQRIGVDQLDRTGHAIQSLGRRSRELAGCMGQQRADTLAAAQYRVAHGFMQTLGGNRRRGQQGVQCDLGALLHLEHPFLEGLSGAHSASPVFAA